MEENQFEFNCPQCGQMVCADESMRGLVLYCPYCEKGIVVPRETREIKKKPRLAPIRHTDGMLASQSAEKAVDYNLIAIQKRLEERTQKTSDSSSNMRHSWANLKKTVIAEARCRKIEQRIGLLKHIIIICMVVAIGYFTWIAFKDEIPREPDKLERVESIKKIDTGDAVKNESNNHTLDTAAIKAIEVVPRVKPYPKLDFNLIKNRVVVIGDEGKGGGTAFLLKMDGKKYLVTNDHVAQATDMFTRIYLLDGTPIKLGAFEVAADRDMVRFEVDDSLPAFEQSDAVPQMDEKIAIYGNSAGKGAITEERGHVKAIGTMRLEVDANVVPGNSGSPVLDMSGNVIGVLSYGTNDSDDKNWAQQNTRYGGVRRWAIRFTGVKWNQVKWKEYVEQVELMEDIHIFRARLAPFIDVRQENPQAKGSSYGRRYDELTKRMFQRDDGRFRAHLLALSKADEAWGAASQEFKQVLGERNPQLTIVEERRRKYQETTRNLDSEIYKSLATLMDVSTNTVWVSFVLSENNVAYVPQLEKVLEIWKSAMRDNDDAQKEMKKKIEEVASVNDKDTPTYQKCKNAVATLRGVSKELKTSGTGFLCEMGGRKYLVTNCHVIDHNMFMQVFFQNGRTYKLPDSAMVEIAANRDLARFDITDIKEMATVKDDEYLSLALDEDVPNIGERIEFYGNAEGEDVITVTGGKILAVGLEKIEIDAKIQGGNSGSPLVRVKDGKVIGVTTRSKFNKLDKDPSKVGTRYDPTVSLTREFAERFAAVKWAPAVKYGTFVRGARKRKEIKLFLGLLEGFCFGSMEFCLDKDLPNYRFAECRDIKDGLNKLAKVDGALRESRDRFDKMVQRNEDNIRRKKGTGGIDSYSVLDFENQIKVINMRTHKCFEARLDLLLHANDIVQRALRKSDVSHKLLDEFLKCSIEKMIRSYQDKYRLQLKGRDLPNIPLVPSSARGAKREGDNNSTKKIRVRW